MLDGSPYAAAILADQPVAYYRLAESSGTTATDVSGGGSDGTYANGVSLSQSGAIVGEADHAASFDGVDDAISLPAAIVDGLSDLSVEFWLQTTKAGGQTFLSGANAGNANEILIYASSSSAFEVYTGESNSTKLGWTTPTIADNVWHHVAVVRDATAANVTLYVDGISRGTQAAPLSALDVDPGGLFVGQDQNAVGGSFDPNEAFRGTLDEFAIFDTALSAEQVLAHYHARYAADPAPPTIVQVDPLSDDGGSITKSFNELTVQLSKDLRPSVVNDAGSWELRRTGDDGTFGTADDALYSLAPNPSYVTGTTISLHIEDGPLPAGTYRFTASAASLADIAGHALDGNSDGVGGDDFVLTFDVCDAPGLVLESESNDTKLSANSLQFIESPAAGGFHLARALGMVDPATSGDTWSDPDYWRFEALAGDRVAVAVDSPDSDVDPYVELRNGADGVLTSDDNAGPGADAYTQPYRIPSDGVYYVRVGKYQWSDVVGEYQLRVELARGIDLESDAEYA
ncbi:MAG: hypothetical protein GX575_33385, partial [Candidatus Anammoximicrobium sp.]|nr:hypothetical protein [Candidatus Anammoximicrobium sp.]